MGYGWPLLLAVGVVVLFFDSNIGVVFGYVRFYRTFYYFQLFLVEFSEIGRGKTRQEGLLSKFIVGILWPFFMLVWSIYLVFGFFFLLFSPFFLQVLFGFCIAGRQLRSCSDHWATFCRGVWQQQDLNPRPGRVTAAPL